ncbi:dethiobiotin synthase [Rhizobium sp. BR 314]|uniref:dethiobiotin synthase n=1 Tax=Rhizobium sp. BR 314 TaxID=3040013 RepID=UPI0039BF1645
MKNCIVVTGTDTDIGKTVFSAGLTGALGAAYWKPIQSGLDGQTDSETVAILGEVPQHRILAEAWRLRVPASPHLAAQLDEVSIVPDLLMPPASRLPLIIEGAGGLLVPLTRNQTFADVFARWRYPTILCARTKLGTINHTLLSIEALRQRKIPILGVAFIGDREPETESIIEHMSGATNLGCLRHLDPLTPETLRRAFTAQFDISDFLEALA